jgi:enoyl-CoA hydratase/carnithine racemase
MAEPTSSGERPALAWTSEGGVVEVRLQRAPCNELGTELLAALEALLDAPEVQAARAVIFHSGLDAGFCAGADLRELQAGMAAIVGPAPDEAAFADVRLREGIGGFIDRIHDVFNRLDALPAVVIGVVHGVCFGGGFELALVCDVLIAEKTARFCFPEMRLGIIPGFGGIPRLRRDVGNGLVRDLLISGRSINAERALAAGLVSQVVNAGRGLGAARSLAKQVVRTDAAAHRAAKLFMKPLPLAELAEEKRIFLELVARPAVFEALTRFVQSTSVRPYVVE